MHAVDQQRHQVEGLQRHALPGGKLRRCFHDEAATDRALAGPPTLHLRAERLQAPGILARGHAHQHLFDHPPVDRISSGHRPERGQRDLAGRGSHAGALEGDLPAAQHHFARRGARPARRPIGLVRIPRSADGGAIFFEHRGEYPQPGSQGQFQQLRLRIDQQIHEGQMA